MRSQFNDRNLNRGFSLVEVMIALFVMSMMSFLAYSISSNMFEQIKSVQELDNLNQEALFLFDRIEKDLQSAFISKVAMVDNGKVEQKLDFLGEEDQLHFISFAHERYYKNAKESSIIEVSYYLEVDEEKSEAFNLYRRVSPQVDDELQKGGRSELLLKDVNALKFEYYDLKEKSFVKEWNTDTGSAGKRLPRLVKIYLQLADREYETVVDLPLHYGLISL